MFTCDTRKPGVLVAIGLHSVIRHRFIGVSAVALAVLVQLQATGQKLQNEASSNENGNFWLDAEHEAAKEVLERHHASVAFIPPPYRVWQVGLRKEGVNTKTLSALRDLAAGDYVWLNATSTELNQRELQLLSKIKGIYHLELYGTSVRDRDLQHIAKLDKLTWLSLSRTKISDEGMRELAELKNLESLRLDDTDIDGSGFVHLSQLSSLHTLEARNTNVGSDGLQALAKISSLRWLTLSSTQIADADLEHLVTLHALQSLIADDTGVTDEGAQRFIERHRSARKAAIDSGEFKPDHVFPLKVGLH